MATGTVILPILAAAGDPTNRPGLAFTATTNRPYLAFDASTQEYVVWTFRMPANYSSAPVLKLQWSGSSAGTSGAAVWECQVMAYTADTDSAAIDTDSYDTTNFVSDTHLGTTAKRLMTTTITLTNADSVAAGDYVALRFSRDADGTNATDDFAEDSWLWGVSLEYTTA